MNEKRKVEINEQELNLYMNKARAFDILIQSKLLVLDYDEEGYYIQAFDSECRGKEILKSQWLELKGTGVRARVHHRPINKR